MRTSKPCSDSEVRSRPAELQRGGGGSNETPGEN